MVEGGIVALHDTKIAPNSPIPLGTMRFYAENIPTFSEVVELDSVDSLTILKVCRTAGCSPAAAGSQVMFPTGEHLPL